MKPAIAQTLTLALLASLIAMPSLAGENCTCRYDGKDVVEGASICMKTPSGLQMAECGRVLNNTAWKFTGKPCPYASLQSSPVQTQIMSPAAAQSG